MSHFLCSRCSSNNKLRFSKKMLTGKKYGRYEVRAKIGAGGMGEVYAAYDEELNRSVALKILSSDFSIDEDKKSRFRREARAASGLNHPNIITIYEIGEHEGNLFISTELIDGKTLRELIRQSPLHIVQALKIATQITDALVAAHSAHIVHRDIKPENVMVRHDGYVKVLDFGLAKPTIENEADLSTDEIIKTTPGLVIGSIRYMSPEQARGVNIDERTDIWSLGVVIYEMLCGKSPFDGATTSDTLANVIYKEPKSILEKMPSAPPELEFILNKCLQKDADARYQTSRELAADLYNLLTKVEHEISSETPKLIDSSISENPTMLHQTASANHPTTVSSIPPTQSATAAIAPNHSFTNRFGLMAGIALLALVGLGFAAYRWFGDSAKTAATAFEKTQISRLSSDGKVRLSAISPDGKYVAYVSGEVGNRSLVVRQIATDSVVTVIQPTSFDFRTVTFTPDANHILYTQSGRDFSVNTLYQIPTLGGTPKKLIEDVDSMPTFSPDGKRLAFLRHVSIDGHDALITANADGSDLKTIFTNKQTSYDFINLLAWSPKGDKMMMVAGNSVGAVGQGAVLLELSTSDNSFRPFGDKKWKSANDVIWLKDGSGLVFAGAEKEDAPSQIWRISYPSGEATQITNDLNNYFNLSISADDSTIFAIKSDSVYGIWDYSVATKTATQIVPDGSTFDGQSGIVQAPDSKIIYTRRDSKNAHLWIADADGKNPKQLTAENADDYNPVVSPDGKYIVFGSNRSGTSRIWRIDIDGKNPKQLTEENQAAGDYNQVVTGDSKSIIFNNAYVGDKQPSSLLKISIDGGPASTVFSKEGFSSFQPQLSPDNKTIAMSAYNQANFEKRLYLAEFDGNQVTKEIGSLEFNLINKYSWSPDGKTLTYLSVDGVPNVWKMSPGTKEKQQITNFTSGRIATYTWSNDGKKLFIVRPIVNNDLVLIKDTNRQKEL
jgi:serine/threonine protein kinase